MNKQELFGLTLVALLLAATLPGVVIGGRALAQSGGDYDLSWSTIDGGGGVVSGGDYVLSGSAGQPDVGPALSGGEYSLVGGFWVGAEAGYKIYLPLVLRNH